MFETNEAITTMTDTLYAVASNLRRGDVLTHGTIEAVVGVPPHTEHWQHVVNKVRRRTEAERGISMWPEMTVGYRLCTVTEQLDLPRLRQIRARRQITKGIRSVESLPTKGLTAHQKRVRAAQIEALRRNRRGITAEIRTQAATAKATETLPRLVASK